MRTPPDETIPILDLGPYLAGHPGADRALAEKLCGASESVGFYFIRNHGVDQSLISQHQIGYLPMGGAKMRSSEVNRNTRYDINEALFIRRERTADDPDVLAGTPWRGLNQWPDNLPGFRETVLTYWRRMERLGQSMLPLYDIALGMPRGFFRERFEGAHINPQLSLYPPSLQADDNLFGIAPHSDSGFMTFLPRSAVPGLEILTVTKEWIATPPMPGTYLVNTGDILHQWTNKRFRSMPHRAINRSTENRYTGPFFCDPNTDVMIECLPGYSSADNPSRYPPRRFVDYCAWFMKMNYRHQEDAGA